MNLRPLFLLSPFFLLTFTFGEGTFVRKSQNNLAFCSLIRTFAGVKYCNMGIFGFFNKEKKETLDKGLEKTKTSVFDKLARAVAGKSKVDDDVLDNLEEVLITSDVGVETTLKVIERIEERVARDKYVSTSELNAILRDEIASLLAENNSDDNDNWDLPSDHKPYVLAV